MNSTEYDIMNKQTLVHIDLDRLIFVPITNNTRKNDNPSYIIIDMDTHEVMGVTSDYGSGQYIANATIDNVALHGSGDTAEESIKNLHDAESYNMLHDNRRRIRKFLEHFKEVEDLIQIKGK